MLPFGFAGEKLIAACEQSERLQCKERKERKDRKGSSDAAIQPFAVLSFGFAGEKLSQPASNLNDCSTVWRSRDLAAQIGQSAVSPNRAAG